MQINTILPFLDIIKQPKNIVITTHTKPDGDAIGSAMGWYHFLIQFGHTVAVVLPNDMPYFLEWIPKATEACINYELHPQKAKSLIDNADYICCLDFNKPNRVSTMADLLMNATQPKVLIDHHLQPQEDFFQYIYSDDAKSSTCEMIYDVIEMMHATDKINLPIMQSLYTGLVTDTGSFRFEATSPNVHRIVIDFKEKGLNHTQVHEYIYDTSTENRLRLLGYLLAEKMVINEMDQYGYIYISKEDLKKYNVKSGDTEGVVNYILTIKEVQVAILATERADGLKLSFRSTGNINVSQFAREHFNGGGHFNAAGANSPYTWQETIALIQNKLPDYIQKSLN